MINSNTCRKICVAFSAALAATLMLSIFDRAYAQGFRGPNYATVTTSASPISVHRGGVGKLIITIAVKTGFHINSAKPLDQSLIATEFTASAVPGIMLQQPKYPHDRLIKVAGSSESVSAYTGTVIVTVPFKVAESAKAGIHAVGGSLTYQGCNATACFPPKQTSISASVTIK